MKQLYYFEDFMAALYRDGRLVPGEVKELLEKAFESGRRCYQPHVENEDEPINQDDSDGTSQQSKDANFSRGPKKDYPQMHVEAGVREDRENEWR